MASPLFWSGSATACYSIKCWPFSSFAPLLYSTTSLTFLSLSSYQWQFPSKVQTGALSDIFVFFIELRNLFKIVKYLKGPNGVLIFLSINLMNAYLVNVFHFHCIKCKRQPRKEPLKLQHAWSHDWSLSSFFGQQNYIY